MDFTLGYDLASPRLLYCIPVCTAMPPSLPEARAVLQKHWGYADFRPGQREVVEGVLVGHDTLAILPTGGGKSICYQVPSVLHDGLTLVISPLIALMQDQVAQLKAHRVPAAFINSSLSRREVEQRWTNAEHGQYELLYVAPERLESDLFMARAERLRIRLLAIDEAHCISEWGHQFRPAYRRIAEARTHMGDPPTLAVTATATPEVRRDIVEQLQLRAPRVIVRGFDRPNIVWSVFQEANKQQKVQDIVQAVPGSGILYAATRRGVDKWARWLNAQGVSAVGYHAGLRKEARQEAQEAWITGEHRVVVATNAFGMGIDKPDVRFVVHVAMPSSLEAYYQEAGRAGRDGARAYAVLLYHPSDEATQEALIENSHPSATEVRQVYDAVCNLGQVPVATLPDDPVVVNLERVAHLTGCARGKIRAAMALLEQQDAWRQVPTRPHHGFVRFRKTVAQLRAYSRSLDNQALAAFVQEVLRAVHAEAYQRWWPLDVGWLARRTDVSTARVQRGLAFLEGRGLLDWHPPDGALRLELCFPRAQKLPIDTAAVARDQKRAAQRLRDMRRYARSVGCRRQFLLGYFGEGHPDRCGTCDSCLGRHTPSPITPDDEPALRTLLRAIADDVPRSAWLPEQPAHRTDALLRYLIREGHVRVVDPVAEDFALTDTAGAYLPAPTTDT